MVSDMKNQDPGREVVLVINPGSTSTKIAVFNRQECLQEETIRHSQEELDRFSLVTEQFDYRYSQIEPIFRSWIGANQYRVCAVVGRGGIVKPLLGGTYRVDQAFLADARSCRYGNHASNLGTLLADRISAGLGPGGCYTVDPVSVDNMYEKARISGVPGIERVCRGHPLNVKRTARKVAARMGVDYFNAAFVVAHLGGGFSITAVENGKVVDVNDALLGMGPFSPNRAGALPLRGVMKLCYSRSEQEVTDLFSKNSGLKAYLGQDDLREVLRMVNRGDKKARLVYEAFVYQIAKEIGACFAALRGRAAAIIVTGGIAWSEQCMKDLEAYVGRLAPFQVVAGENEMEALAEGAFRVVDGEEEPAVYAEE